MVAVRRAEVPLWGGLPEKVSILGDMTAEPPDEAVPYATRAFSSLRFQVAMTAHTGGSLSPTSSRSDWQSSGPCRPARFMVSGVCLGQWWLPCSHTSSSFW